MSKVNQRTRTFSKLVVRIFFTRYPHFFRFLVKKHTQSLNQTKIVRKSLNIPWGGKVEWNLRTKKHSRLELGSHGGKYKNELMNHFSVGTFTICLWQKRTQKLRLPKVQKVTLIFSAESIHSVWNILTESVLLTNFWLFEPHMTSFWWVVPPQS